MAVLAAAARRGPSSRSGAAHGHDAAVLQRIRTRRNDHRSRMDARAAHFTCVIGLQADLHRHLLGRVVRADDKDARTLIRLRDRRARDNDGALVARSVAQNFTVARAQ